jgi:general secretion pathway protein D
MNRAFYSAASVVMLLLATAFALPASAQQSFSPHAIDLYQLISNASAETGKEIVYGQQLLESRFGISSTAGNDADYETLLAALRSMGFAAIETSDQIRIVPEETARTQPSRILREDDRNVSDHAIVTRVISIPLREIETPDGIQTVSTASQLVPVLRPMLGTNAQMGAAQGTNKVVIVDRYDNIRRITQVIEEIVDGL